MASAEFLSPKEFAARIGVDYRTVLRAIAAGQIRAIQVGQQWRIPRSELEPKPVAQAS
jgi:excisionase family DNA binding protein